MSLDALDVAIDDAISPKLAAAPEVLRNYLASAGDVLARELLSRVQAKVGGAVLEVRTGRFLASLREDVAAGTGGMVATIASGAPQAVVLEYGGEIPAHEIVPVDAKALRFAGSAGALFAQHIRVPDIRIPAHSYLRSALAEMRDTIETVLIERVDLALAVGLA